MFRLIAFYKLAMGAKVFLWILRAYFQSFRSIARNSSVTKKSISMVVLSKNAPMK